MSKTMIIHAEPTSANKVAVLEEGLQEPAFVTMCWADKLVDTATETLGNYEDIAQIIFIGPKTFTEHFAEKIEQKTDVPVIRETGLSL